MAYQYQPAPQPHHQPLAYSDVDPPHHQPATSKKSTVLVTLTLAVAVNHHSTVVTVIVALQYQVQVTNHVLLTVATLVLLLVHVTDLFSALAGATVAVSWEVAQTLLKVIDEVFRVTHVTNMYCHI